MQQPISQHHNQFKLTKKITIIKDQNSIHQTPINSRQMFSPSQLDTSIRKKKNQISSQRRPNDIEIAHNQLNNYIELLDTKVSKLVQKHQAQFLIAYRNHIKKVRQQMQEIKNKAMSTANSTISQTQKIESLQKQLIMFREESLKLYQKVNENQGTIDSLITKINQLESQKSLLQKNIREITRRNKQLQGLNYQTQTKKSTQAKSIQKQFFISRPTKDQLQNLNKTGATFTRSRPYTTAINSKVFSLRSRNNSISISKGNKKLDRYYRQQQILNTIDQKLRQNTDQQIIETLKQKLKQIIHNQRTQIQQKPRINYQSLNIKQINLKKPNKIFFQNSKNYAKRSELQQYFFKSIQTVKKQITRRKGLKSINFYSQYANLNLNQFKKLDFFRLLEILLSNDQIIVAIHQKIFSYVKEYK